jgi:hypothetical protein
LAALVGPLMGFAIVYLDGLLCTWTGRWLGGGASFPQCRAAVAWSRLPQIAALLLWAQGVWLLGGELFLKETPRLDAHPALFFLLGIAGVLWLGGVIWSYVLRWKCLGEVHGFSAWRGFFTTLLAWGLVVGLAVAAVFAAAWLRVGPFAERRPTAGDASAAASGGQRERPLARDLRIEVGKVEGWLRVDGQSPVARALA